MTVRVSKPEFNLREKISELDKPTGLKGDELMRSETTQEARDLIGAGRRNLIINGDMRIWQRSNGNAVTHSGSLQFGPDRWMFEEGCNNLVAVLTRSTDTPSGQGFKYSFQLSPSQAESALDNSDFAQYMYFVEGYDFAPAQWGTTNAKPCTFSFWFKTSMGGEHYVTFNSASGVDVWSTSIRSTANVWEHHVITIPPPTTGTWNTTNGRGLEIRIGLMRSANVSQANSRQWYYGGTAYNGFADAHSDWAFSTSNNAYLTGVQLEIGSQATPFEHRPYAEELLLCQRYAYRLGGLSKAYQVVGTGFIGQNGGTKCAKVVVHLPTTMRSNPSVSVIGTDAFWGHTGAAFSDMACTLTSNTGGTWADASSGNQIWLDFGRTSGGQPDNGTACVVYTQNSNQGEVFFNAEI